MSEVQLFFSRAPSFLLAHHSAKKLEKFERFGGRPYDFLNFSLCCWTSGRCTNRKPAQSCLHFEKTVSFTKGSILGRGPARQDNPCQIYASHTDIDERALLFDRQLFFFALQLDARCKLLNSCVHLSSCFFSSCNIHLLFHWQANLRPGGGEIPVPVRSPKSSTVQRG